MAYHHHGSEDHIYVVTTSTPSLDLTPVTVDHSGHTGHHISTLQLWTASKLLVNACSLDSVQGLIAAMLLSAFLSVIYEGSKFYYHLGKILHRRKQSDRWHGTQLAHYVSRLWKALAYMVHFAIGYTLMLCAMTFNVWVLASVCLGSGIGYYFLLPVIQHVLHVQADHLAHASHEHTALVTCHEISEKSGTSFDVGELETIEQHCQNTNISESDHFLQQISNVTHCVRETTL